MDNSSSITIANNLVFYDISKHIDIIFHYPLDCITNKEVKVKYVKIQDQVASINFHKATQTWYFCQDEKYAKSYKKYFIIH
jgi:hypothetical protein